MEQQHLMNALSQMTTIAGGGRQRGNNIQHPEQNDNDRGGGQCGPCGEATDIKRFESSNNKRGEERGGGATPFHGCPE